jgi:SAM-dependent methyltransferase
LADRGVQERITSFWSTVAADYEAHPGNVPARDSAEYRAWVEAVRDLLPPQPAQVLDIATGTGFLALIAAGLGHRVTGIDLSAAMVAQAKAEAGRRGLQGTFQVADAVSPPFPNASFDAIVCRHFLWTLREPLTALANWRALLRPGGPVIAIDGFWFREPPQDEPAGEGPGLFAEHYTRETVAALPVMRATEVGAVEKLFREAGFARVEVSYLTAVHSLAEDPPGTEPWYVITAR